MPDLSDAGCPAAAADSDSEAPDSDWGPPHTSQATGAARYIMIEKGLKQRRRREPGRDYIETEAASSPTVFTVSRLQYLNLNRDDGRRWAPGPASGRCAMPGGQPRAGPKLPLQTRLPQVEGWSPIAAPGPRADDVALARSVFKPPGLEGTRRDESESAWPYAGTAVQCRRVMVTMIITLATLTVA